MQRQNFNCTLSKMCNRKQQIRDIISKKKCCWRPKSFDIWRRKRRSKVASKLCMNVIANKKSYKLRQIVIYKSNRKKGKGWKVSAGSNCG